MLLGAYHVFIGSLTVSTTAKSVNDTYVGCLHIVNILSHIISGIHNTAVQSEQVKPQIYVATCLI